ncbi:MAG: 2-amino-4-hydroxy-6-hydroxymethyldihydropteridine diphosphokinase [Candidatus Omnitrophica bacterium]|nr:2-amino-4-hydroxy-6-hydroxymethyldihydropteridine diphosphokinase [Candidatus Omnitrophota bacterium]
MSNTSVIGLGSNIDPEKNIAAARALLKQEFQVLGESRFVQTAPVGYIDQDDFINGAVHIETDLPLADLSSRLKQLEERLGRQRSVIKHGPRTIDLDVVVFNGQIIDNDFYERDFLRDSVLELIPKLVY